MFIPMTMHKMYPDYFFFSFQDLPHRKYCEQSRKTISTVQNLNLDWPDTDEANWKYFRERKCERIRLCKRFTFQWNARATFALLARIIHNFSPFFCIVFLWKLALSLFPHQQRINEIAEDLYKLSRFPEIPPKRGWQLLGPFLIKISRNDSFSVFEW
jgi:hypothetical protein